MTPTPELDVARIAELKRVASAAKEYPRFAGSMMSRFRMEFTPEQCLALLSACESLSAQVSAAKRDLLNCGKLFNDKCAELAAAQRRGDEDARREAEALPTVEQMLTAERDALRKQVEAMREAMGEEFNVLDEHKRGWLHRCSECKRIDGNYDDRSLRHVAGCSRGRFFAALADVRNALADALGLKVDEIDPNRLPEYVKQLAQRGKS